MKKLLIGLVALVVLAVVILVAAPGGALFKAVGVTGLPTTFLIDRRGQIVGAYPGAAEWDGPEARALIEHYLRRPARRL